MARPVQRAAAMLPAMAWAMWLAGISVNGKGRLTPGLLLFSRWGESQYLASDLNMAQVQPEMLEGMERGMTLQEH